MPLTVGGDSRTRALRWKAFGFAGKHAAGKVWCLVWYELRGVEDSLRQDNAASMKLCKSLAKAEPLLRAYMQMFGTSFERSIMPSRKAWPKGELMHECARQEYQLSTLGLLPYLYYWCECRHRITQRDFARSSAECFLNSLLDDSIFAKVNASKIIGATLALCDAASVTLANACVHVAELVEFEASLMGPAGTTVWQVIGFLANRANHCGACARWLRDSCRIVARSLDHGLAEVGRDNPLKHAAMYVTTCKRKRRVDEDYVAAVAARVQAGKAGNSGIVCRALGDVASTTSSAWDAKAVLQYAAQGHLAFAGVEECSLTYDGARLGKLAEETVMFCLERVDTGDAMWLPPHVLQLTHARRVVHAPLQKPQYNPWSVHVRG